LSQVIVSYLAVILSKLSNKRAARAARLLF